MVMDEKLTNIKQLNKPKPPPNNQTTNTHTDRRSRSSHSDEEPERKSGYSKEIKKTIKIKLLFILKNFPSFCGRAVGLLVGWLVDLMRGEQV